MWETLLKVQNFIQLIQPLRIQYHRSNRGFHETHTKTPKVISFLIDSNVFLIWLASLVCLKSAMTQTPDSSVSVQQSVLRMVLQVLFFGLFSLFLASVYTFQSTGSTTVWMMTQAIGFYAKREKKDTFLNLSTDPIDFQCLIYFFKEWWAFLLLVRQQYL